MFEKHLRLVPLILALGLTRSTLGKTPTYWWKSTQLGITTAAPPALIYVSDDQGRRTGANINSPVNQYGEQDPSFLLQGIPQSGVVQTNIADNDTGQLSSTTPWNINIMDGGAQAYSIHLVGISNDIEELNINLFYHARTVTTLTKTVFIPVENGVTKTVTLNCDPSSRILTVVPVMVSGDFLKDTQAACGLGSISPPEACEALEALAAAVEKAKSKGNSRLEAETLELYLSILNRLHDWGQKGYRQDWDDFKDRHECDNLRQVDFHKTKFFAKDPAYSALKLDAETLLKGLPKGSDRGHDGDGGYHKNDDRKGDRHDRDQGK
jgi:hypothetical protein